MILETATQPEPMAWRINGGSFYLTEAGAQLAAKRLGYGAWYFPVYAEPPHRKWQGLTVKEIQSIHDTYYKRMGPQEFARAIEQALKEKNA